MITLSKTNSELTKFLVQFHAQTSPHPTSAHLRIWKERVIFEISIFAGSIRLSFIGALQLGQGDGTAALKWLIQLANSHQITIQGTVQRMNPESLNAKQLRFWYKKHGFTVERNTIVYHGIHTYTPPYDTPAQHTK